MHSTGLVPYPTRSPTETNFFTPCFSISPTTASRASRLAWMSPRIPYFMRLADFPLPEEGTRDQKNGAHEQGRIRERQRQIRERSDPTLVETHLQVKVAHVRHQVLQPARREGQRGRIHPFDAGDHVA